EGPGRDTRAGDQAPPHGRNDDPARTLLLSSTTTWDAVRARRLARQWLSERAGDPVAVARDTCGIHAQVQASAELQLAIPVDRITQADVPPVLVEGRA